ncbi:hypothetical protein MCETHM1_02668 [Flavobacteriaceae bacterium]|jgi:hypothetical protein
MTALTVKPKNKKELLMVSKFLEAFNVKFETIEEDKPYNVEFVDSILQAREDSKQGKGIKIALEDLWK